MKKTVKTAAIVLTVCILLAAGGIFYIATHWSEKNVVTDIAEYEAYFGPQGIHRTMNTEVYKKTRESYLVIDSIFPEALPDSAVAEDFYYEYYNPWDPCYLSYLVCAYSPGDYAAEAARLEKVGASYNYLTYGATGFSYPLLAAEIGSFGYIYALADEAQHRIIYVELTFCNSFTDIDYEAVIPAEHLPIGFDAKMKKQP